jgi:NAD(P)-dependent dehydrogenase (short-subunit alcohol dehydrogenase family)
MMTTNRPVALVTGASSGIGKAAAIALAGAGFEVIGTGRNTARVTAPAGVTYLDLDVTSDESVASVVKQVIDRFGRIDVLVNNAGVGANGAAEEFSVARTQDVFDINVYGIMRMTKAVLPHMRAQRRGRVINVSSLSGFVPSPFMAIYTSTKHAVEGYSGSLDHEVREHGVRILLVEPGPVNTPFGDHSVQGDTPIAALRVGTAHLRRGAGEKHQRRRRSRRRGQGDRRGGHRPEPETAAHRRLDGRKHQRAPPRPSGPDLRPHRPQIQPDAELTLTFRVPEPSETAWARPACPTMRRSVIVGPSAALR